jgi:hypothetical protein
MHFRIFIFSSKMRCKFVALFLANGWREATLFFVINYESPPE